MTFTDDELELISSALFMQEQDLVRRSREYRRGDIHLPSIGEAEKVHALNDRISRRLKTRHERDKWTTIRKVEGRYE